MRQIYTSPRQENIDAVVALMAEHGIEATVTNRSNYNRPTWQRFSYTQRRTPATAGRRCGSPARTTTPRREPCCARSASSRSSATARSWRPHAIPRRTQRAAPVVRVRRIVLLAVLAAFAMVVLRYMHVV
jgi:hypothetical protein